MLWQLESWDRASVQSCERIVLRSRTYGRERWELKELLGSPIRALSLQALLSTEPGVKRVEANPLTGRVLLEYRSQQLQESTQTMILRALNFGPMSSEELPILRAGKKDCCPSPLGILVSAELGCFFLKFWLFGLTCPAVAATGVVALGWMALSRFWCRPEVVSEALTPARRIIANEASRIENDENRTEIVQHSCDDRIN